MVQDALVNHKPENKKTVSNLCKHTIVLGRKGNAKKKKIDGEKLRKETERKTKKPF